MDQVNSVSDDLALAIEATRRGGRVAFDAFRAAHDVQVKDEGKGIVTEADKAGEEAIIEGLRSRSAHAILGEESGRTEGSSGLYWVVDPIDGTTNFAKDVPLFVVTVALLRGSDVVLGVVHHPLTEETYYAERGKGAYLNDRRIQVSSVADLSAAMLFLDHGYAEADRKRWGTVCQRLGPDCSVRSHGATAMAMSWVAAGFGEAFMCSGDELWDFAAGIVLVEEAGGRLTDWRGEDWDGSNTFILASNGRLHDRLVERVQDLQPGDS